jgi:hypothetical protein
MVMDNVLSNTTISDVVRSRILLIRGYYDNITSI